MIDARSSPNCARLAADLREERREAVVVLLAPLLERMVMAAGTLNPQAEEQLGRVFDLLVDVLHLAIPGDRRVLADLAGGGQQCRGRTGRRACSSCRLCANPVVESVGAAHVVAVLPACCAGSRSTCWRSSRHSRCCRAARRPARRAWSGLCRPGTARVSSGVGSRPAMSIAARRRNVASSHTADGGTPSVLSLANTSSSTKFFGGGRLSTGTPSGTLARNTATCPW